MKKMDIQSLNALTEKVIKCAMRVHSELGPGFLESVYQAALAYEFDLNGISYEREKECPVSYRGIKLTDVGFRCDFLVERVLVLEIKAVRETVARDEAQLLNYLKILELPLGLMINFNVLHLKDGIKRMLNPHVYNQLAQTS